jgi:hypothetical protein
MEKIQPVYVPREDASHYGAHAKVIANQPQQRTTGCDHDTPRGTIVALNDAIEFADCVRGIEIRYPEVAHSHVCVAHEKKDSVGPPHQLALGPGERPLLGWAKNRSKSSIALGSPSRQVADQSGIPKR